MPLLTKREAKMAGYWPSSKRKKERGHLTEQAWSIKDLLYGFIFKLKLQQQNKTDKKLFCSERNSSQPAGVRFIFSAFLD